MLLRLLVSLAGALALGACATTMEMPVVSTDPMAPDEAWARVLKTRVDERGRVDFEGLAAEPDDLRRYVAYVYRVDPESAPAQFPTPQSRLAYYLNSYNALSMYNVIDSGIPEGLGLIGRIRFFIMKDVQVGGRSISLYDYENKVIRPFGDERVHFGLNCMAVGCPRLPRQPFTAANIDAELDREARFFFSETRNLRVDDAARTIHLSEILDFFPEDFLKKEKSLIAYVNRYRSPPIPEDYKVQFIPYDWTVNAQPKRVAGG